MRIKEWLRGLWHRRKEQGATARNTATKLPLREFVYLDEVTLRSLLASQTGAVTDQVSSAITQAEQAELTGKISASAGVAKSEIGSRYQTSNTQNIQTSRKAIVQSLFKEFRELSAGQLLLEPSEAVTAFESTEQIAIQADSLRSVNAKRLRRGSLIEIEVELTVDPVFKMSTMFAEMSELAKEYPAMLDGAGATSVFEQMGPVNKALQHLLAGLIPIRSRAIDYSVVSVDGKEFVVHNDAVSGLDIQASPLEVVGVTEHLSYWKDIRRILFSGARFTMLCRIGRDGIHHTWTPVKLADLFADVAPGLTDQLNSAGRLGFTQPQVSVESTPGHRVSAALRHYAKNALAQLPVTPTPEQSVQLEARIAVIDVQDESVSSQREAFRALDQYLEQQLGISTTPEKALELRQAARADAGIELFPTTQAGIIAPPARTESMTADDGALLDTEVIAIYW